MLERDFVGMVPGRFWCKRLGRTKGASWAALACLLLGLFVGSSTTACGQGLSAAGAGKHLWVAKPKADADQFTVFHRVEGDPPHTLEHVQTLHGKLAAHGFVANGARLWLVYVDGTVQTIRAGRGPTDQSWVFEDRVRRDLPKSVTLKALAVHHDEAWALVRVDTAKGLKQLDRAAEKGKAQAREPGEATGGPRPFDEAARRRLAIGLPPIAAHDVPASSSATPKDDATSDDKAERSTGEKPGEESGGEGNGAPSAGDAKQAKSAQANGGTAAGDRGLPVDRLLRLEGERWARVPLSEDWSGRAEAQASLASVDNEQLAPVLMRLGEAEKSDELTIFRGTSAKQGAGTGDHWQRTQVRVPGHGGMDVVVVDQQIVIGRRTARDSEKTAGQSGLGVMLSVLHGKQLTTIGTLGVKGARTDRWSLVPLGFNVGLMTQSAKTAGEAQANGASNESDGGGNGGDGGDGNGGESKLGLMLSSMNLQGEVVTKPTALVAKPEPTLLDQADYLIMIAVLALATGLMLMFWRRDPRKQRLRLAPGYVLGSLARRGLAGAIDLAPAVGVVLVAFNISAKDLLLRWPGQPAAASWDELVPGLAVIGLVIAHTTIAELFADRSLGKALTGLQVRSLSSRPAKRSQILIRGLLRIFDLIAWLLLLLPVISPFRQRLGDLVARTVVVMPKPQDGQDAGRNEE